jgi:succinate dehydrogenase/fumarate reductase flavoprotein subunit
VIENPNDKSVSVTRAGTVIVGAGAAGMNAAVRLLEFQRTAGAENPGDDLLVVTGGLALGASRMSGSDKQTYYKMGTSPSIPDTAEDFAATLTAFGCCHGDTALAEGVGSLRGFYHLVEAGVPFPHDPSGAFIGYKTDHDPAERATSAGPKTSRFMSECLQAIVERAGVRIIDKHPVLKFVTSDSGADKRIAAMICLDLTAAGDEATVSVFLADNWILAGGGPGDIYQSTVYPRGQIGLHAPALEAGLTACNLTESQYGLASIKFRWNVSGTYMQAIPRIFSTDSDGADEREFLTEYFDDMPSMATNIFLKGYQWPFDAQRITEHQSSLIDMAVHQETAVRGRRVWMDFLHNPVGGDGWDKFDLGALGEEAGDYLTRTGASQTLPIERLAHMNTPAIELYAEHDILLHSEPLEIAVCAQHMNGGFAVDQWWQSNIPRTFVIGEMAGTHGVKRPGGSALNAGQVGALRAAEYIACACNTPPGEAPDDPVTGAAAEAIAEINRMLEASESASQTPREVMEEIRQRMTRFGAHLRSRTAAREALDAAGEQYKRLSAEGIKIAGGAELYRAIAARQQCLTQIAMLKAICAMFDRGAGSRGSHCILDDNGVEMHRRLIDPETDRPYRFKGENEALRNEIIEITFSAEADDLFETRVTVPRPVPVNDTAFEPAWAEFREGRIYDKGSSHGN